MRLESISFHLRNCVEDACRTLALSANQKGLELLSHVQHDIPAYLQGDPHRLRQVLINLINNAIKFTKSGDIVVKVAPESADVEEPELHFTVTDSGIGIPKEIQEKIFAQFTQADGSIARRFGGTGLGLAICREIISLMSGRIWVESAPGEGSCFHFVIPLQPAVETVVNKADDTDTISLRGYHLLVVESNLPLRLALQEMLLAHEAEVSLTESGAEALDLLNTHQPGRKPIQMVLFDCRLSDLNGFEFAEALAKVPGPPLHAIVMLPPNHRQNDREQFEKRGVPATILKPVKEQVLMALIQEGLGGRAKRMASKPSSMVRRKKVQLHQRLRVLLAEDSLDNKLLAERLLTQAGHWVTWAENGHQVLKHLKEKRIDVILMDVNMPEMDGVTVTRMIRQGTIEQSDPNVPIIALSADVLPEEKARCLEAGMDLYISKPYRPEQLLSSLESLGRQIKDSAVRKSVEIRQKIQSGTPILEPMAPDDYDMIVARDSFARHASQWLADLEQALEHQNGQEMGRIAERLRALAIQIRAPRLKRGALRFTMAARRGEAVVRKLDGQPLVKAVREVLQALQG